MKNLVTENKDINKSVSLRLNKSLLEEINKITEVFSISLTDFIRNAVEKEVKEIKKDFFYKLSQVDYCSDEESKEIIEELNKMTEDDLNVDEIELIIKYSKLVEKFFEKHLDIENQFLKNLEAFYIGKEKNIDIKKLKGTIIPQYRMRIGSYRVIFTVNKESIKVYSIYVEKAGSRGEIYKN